MANGDTQTVRAGVPASKSEPTGKSPPNRKLLIDHAIEYAGRGWSVIPVVGQNPPNGMKWTGYQSVRPTEHELKSLFAGSGITGLAVICGPVSGGLVVRDFDEMAGYDRWAATYPTFARSLPTVATARGRHVYFRGPEGYFDFRELGRYDFGDGEYRGDAKHYVCLPPSAHPDGPTYQWLIQLSVDGLPEIDPVQAGLLTPEVLARRKAGDMSSNTAGTATSVQHSSTQQPQLTHQTQASTGSRRQWPAFAGGGRFDPRVEEAISKTLPSQTGRRNRKLFDLARELMAIPELAGAEPAQLRPIVQEWHRRGLAAKTIKTKDFAKTWTDFMTAWDRIEHPAGQGTIEAAFGEAASLTPSPQVVALYPDEPKMALLANLCKVLQRRAGTEDFFLDTRSAGRLLVVDHTTAWSWLKALCIDKVLRAGEKGSQATHKASQFRYVAEQ